MALLELLALTGGVFVLVEERVDTHGFDAIAILVTLGSSLLCFLGVLKLARRSRDQNARKLDSPHRQ